MKNKTDKYSILIIFLLTFLLIGNSCMNNPTGSSILSQSSQISPGSELSSVSSESLETKMKYRIFAPHDQVMLIPASVPDYNQGVTKRGQLFYSLSDDMTQWKPVPSKVTKIASITGRRYNALEDSTIDIFQVAIGDWTGYYKRGATQPQDNIECRILIEDNSSDTGFEQRSKDYTVMQIFDDIYAVGADGKLKMVSSRKIGPYDYNTISKEGIGDLHSWEWIFQPVCSSKDNLVFYLTSRDKKFYSIWILDLDNGTEKRFGQDVAYQLGGIGNQELIANIRDEVTGAYHGKLLSTSDSTSYVPLPNSQWHSSNEWLYYLNVNELTVKKGAINIGITTSSIYIPLLLKDDSVWLRALSQQGNQAEYLRLDLKNSTYTLNISDNPDTLASWNILLADLNSKGVPFAQANEQGIKISTLK